MNSHHLHQKPVRATLAAPVDPAESRPALPPLPLVNRPLSELRPNPRNARTHPKRKIQDLARTIEKIGFIGAIVTDPSGMILAGHARYAAAKLAGMREVPTLTVHGRSDAMLRAYVLADNKFAERAGWDREILSAELGELSALLPSLDLDIGLTGFEAGELDVVLSEACDETVEPEDRPVPTGPRVTGRGDLWVLGKHRLLCGDAREAADYDRLMGGVKANAVFADPPYNVRIKGHVQGRGRVRHEEFAFASGEMSDEEFAAFLDASFREAAANSVDGAVHYICIDWRHIDTLVRVGRNIYGAMLNLVVWNKTSPGQGSFYRSQHELIAVFRVGDGAHRNNIELGRFGRNRSNLWTYAGVNGFGADRLEALAIHPTVKPVGMIADAIRDCTTRGDLVLDPFLGSGSTLLAAEKTGRRCFGIEYEPGYVDVAIRRWQVLTRKDALLASDGRTFDEVATARQEVGAEQTESPPPPEAPDLTDPPDWTALCTPVGVRGDP